MPGSKLKPTLFTFLAIVSGCAATTQQRVAIDTAIEKRMLRGDINDYHKAHDQFIRSALAGDEQAMFRQLSSITSAKNQLQLTPFIKNVVAYFSDYKEMVACNGIIMVTDEYKNHGYVFHKAFKTKSGNVLPYRMVILNEYNYTAGAAQTMVSNLVPGRTKYHEFCYNQTP